MRVNVRRGLFRLWLVCAVGWCAIFSYIGYRDVRAARDTWEPPSWQVLLPKDCASARGVLGTDFEEREGRCWYGVPKFRASFPEYRDLSDDDLTKKLYRKIGILPVDHSGITELRQDALIALGNTSSGSGRRVGSDLGDLRIPRAARWCRSEGLNSLGVHPTTPPTASRQDIAPTGSILVTT
jgi:hypothetical protein